MIIRSRYDLFIKQKQKQPYKHATKYLTHQITVYNYKSHSQNPQIPEKLILQLNELIW